MSELPVESFPLSFRRSRLTEEELAAINLTVERATALLNLLVPVSLDPDRAGGQLSLCHIEQNGGVDQLVVDAIIPIGTMPTDRVKTYFAVAQEKVKRLFAHLSRGHRTSYESRVEGHGRYGGAVCGCRRIVSLSGLEEFDDEALVMNLMVWEGWLQPAEAAGLAEAHDNFQFRKLFEISATPDLYAKL